MSPVIPNPATALLAGMAVLGLVIASAWLGRRAWHRLRRPSPRVLREDILKALHRSGSSSRPLTSIVLARTLRVSPAEVDCALSLLREESLLIDNGSLLSLTPEGIRTATRVVRAHRLWERHLADETGFPETEWHALADRREHELSPGEVEDLSVRLGRPTLDPHGDPIPGASGEIASPHSVPLSALPAGAGAQIVHLEDEPEERYAELAALGLYPGLFIRMLDGREAGYRFLADGQEHVLSALAAGNISVLPTPPRSPSGGAVDEPLSVLRPGETATVMHISRRCRGAERRRLLDLGLLPGTSVQAEIAAPSGDPTAYRVRGGLIALRQDQARFIRIQRAAMSRP